MKILALVLMMCCATYAGTFRNLGPQITATTTQGSAFTKDPSGRSLICCVVRGQPAKLCVFDTKIGELLHRLPLNDAEGAWNATAASDGSIYVGTDPNGHLFRWVPGASAVTDLGKVPPAEKFVWDVTPGLDGEVFCGTYPGCRIVRYHPKDGFRDVTGGPLVEKENYARCVAYDPVHHKVFGGVGSHAHLVEVDLKTGKRIDLLPKEHHDQEFVYGMRILGERLFATVTNSQVGLVYNTKTRQFERPLKEMPSQLVMTKHPSDERVIYTANGNCYSYDPTKPTESPTKLFDTPEARAMMWEDQTLVLFNARGHVIRWTAQTGKQSVMCKVPPEFVPIQSMTLGPDGKIWMGGYLSGGNAAYEPAADKSQEYKGLSQAESITSLGSSLYFGIYPHGRFFTYDTSKPWDQKQNNPHSLGKIERQSRPFGALGVPELNQVFWGTVPEYGLLGGGIAVYDIASKKLDFHPNIIPKQSIVTLAYNKGLIVGGSTIFGGLGIEPGEKYGRLFLWDPTGNRKLFETDEFQVPAVMALINGPDNNVWGVAGEEVFVFDVESRKILKRQKLCDAPRDPKQHLWRGPTLRLHPNGKIYGDLEGKLFALDPATLKTTILRKEDASLTTLDSGGNIYFRDRVNLWKYVP